MCDTVPRKEMQKEVPSPEHEHRGAEVETTDTKQIEVPSKEWGEEPEKEAEEEEERL